MTMHYIKTLICTGRCLCAAVREAAMMCNSGCSALLTLQSRA